MPGIDPASFVVSYILWSGLLGLILLPGIDRLLRTVFLFDRFVAPVRGNEEADAYIGVRTEPAAGGEHPVIQVVKPRAAVVATLRADGVDDDPLRRRLERQRSDGYRDREVLAADTAARVQAIAWASARNRGGTARRR